MQSCTMIRKRKQAVPQMTSVIIGTTWSAQGWHTKHLFWWYVLWPSYTWSDVLEVKMLSHIWLLSHSVYTFECYSCGFWSSVGLIIRKWVPGLACWRHSAKYFHVTYIIPAPTLLCNCHERRWDCWACFQGMLAACSVAFTVISLCQDTDFPRVNWLLLEIYRWSEGHSKVEKAINKSTKGSSLLK